jgi:hypothetical protein
MSAASPSGGAARRALLPTLGTVTCLAAAAMWAGTTTALRLTYTVFVASRTLRHEMAKRVQGAAYSGMWLMIFFLKRRFFMKMEDMLFMEDGVGECLLWSAVKPCFLI